MASFPGCNTLREFQPSEVQLQAKHRHKPARKRVFRIGLFICFSRPRGRRRNSRKKATRRSKLCFIGHVVSASPWLGGFLIAFELFSLNHL